MTSRFGFGSKMNKWLSFRIIKYFRTVLLLIGGKVLLHCWISTNIFGNCLLLLNDVILSKSTKMLFKVDYKKKRINRALMLIMKNFIRNVFGNYLNSFCLFSLFIFIFKSEICEKSLKYQELRQVILENYLRWMKHHLLTEKSYVHCHWRLNTSNTKVWFYEDSQNFCTY